MPWKLTVRANAAAVVFLLYLGISGSFFGLRILSDPRNHYVGTTADPAGYIWSLAWWPYALYRGLDPFISKVIWAPDGFNLAWATCIPAWAILFAPFTAVFGPVVAYNVLAVVLPAAAAWTCFLLCRHLSGNTSAAVVGGYLFGFSTYILGHAIGHLAQTSVLLVPVAVHLVVLKCQGRLSAVKFLALMSLLLAAQFAIAIETFLTLVVFGSMALALAVMAHKGPARRAALHTSLLCLVSLIPAALIVSPYLYRLFVPGAPEQAIHNPVLFSTDLVNLVVPTPVSLASVCYPASIPQTFVGNYIEATGYFGVPLLLIVMMYVCRNWNTACGFILTVSFCLILIASLGPVLHVAGQEIAYLPWALTMFVPLVSHALPARFIMYATLVAAVVATLWLNADPLPRRLKLLLIVLSIASLLPNFCAWRFWCSQVDTPPFFAHGLYKQYINPGETILALPYGDQTNCLLWQAQTDMYFRLAGGYVSTLVPPEYKRWPVLQTLCTGRPVENYGAELIAFLKAHQIRWVVIATPLKAPWRELRPSLPERKPPRWHELLSGLGVKPIEIGGISLYRIP